MSVALRPYQEASVNAVRSYAESNEGGKAMVVLPTGTGKTVVFSHLIAERGGSALILAHRDELLRQAADKLAMVAPELAMSIGFVQAGRDDVGAPVVVASVATLARERRLERLPKRWDTVIVDEAHHAAAASYRKVLDALEAKVTVGFTATPERTDDKALSEVFDEVVYARSLLEMIRDGYLCDLRGVRVRIADLDLSKVKVSGGDYQAKDLGRAMEAAHAPTQTAAALLEHAPDRKTVVFVPTVDLARDTAAAIDEAGIPAAYVYGEMGTEDRHEALRRFESGEVRAMVNVDVLTEGYDEPSIDCVCIAAPTKSRIAYVQRVGRGTRIHPGKDECLILDLVGVTSELKLQSLHSLFNLESPPKAGERITDAIDRVERERHERGAARDLGAGGPSTSEEVDVFGRDRLHWLHIDERWVLTFGQSDLLALDPVADSWRVLHVREEGARILASGLDLGYAQGAAEEAVRKRGVAKLVDTKAKWRRRKPSSGQLKYLARLGVATKPESCGQAADLITEAQAVRQLERLDRAIQRSAA